ncbi:hypothetical protein BJ508DRAFT_314256 [Ascobolus immersus RN42]|uniref:Uncharacterized protein n=1 Tax=Ascobolus immersus RN42 TaxID=1160509 RepID=A0A3N4HLN8_ASCIM|nr:hypothetical protein BJ508DRAFT_314256 [Ascobolus immersus RN42]
MPIGKRARIYRQRCRKIDSPTLQEAKKNMQAIQLALCSIKDFPLEVDENCADIKDLSCGFRGYLWRFGSYQLPTDIASGKPKMLYKFTNQETKRILEAIKDGEVGLYKCENEDKSVPTPAFCAKQGKSYRNKFDFKGDSVVAEGTVKNIATPVAYLPTTEMVTDMQEEIERLKNSLNLVEGGRRLVIKRLTWFKRRLAEYESILTQKERELDVAIQIICDRDETIYRLEQELCALKWT